MARRFLYFKWVRLGLFWFGAKRNRPSGRSGPINILWMVGGGRIKLCLEDMTSNAVLCYIKHCVNNEHGNPSGFICNRATACSVTPPAAVGLFVPNGTETTTTIRILDQNTARAFVWLILESENENTLSPPFFPARWPGFWWFHASQSPTSSRFSSAAKVETTREPEGSESVRRCLPGTLTSPCTKMLSLLYVLIIVLIVLICDQTSVLSRWFWMTTWRTGCFWFGSGKKRS